MVIPFSKTLYKYGTIFIYYTIECTWYYMVFLKKTMVLAWYISKNKKVLPWYFVKET